jgi:aminoglycoside phosphotransferase
MEAVSVKQRALAAAQAVASDRGVRCEQAAVACSGSNVLVHLRPAPVVARVMAGTVVLHDDPRRWLNREVSVLRFLAPSGLAVAPSDLIAPGPYEQDGMWLTCWKWIPHQRQSKLPIDAESLGHALRDLHHELSAFRGELGDLLDVYRDIRRLHRQLRPTAALSDQTIDSLRGRLRALGDTVFTSSLPTQALHGDASLSNLLLTPERLVWNDFEDTFRGPVHWDLAGYVMSLRARGADSTFIARVLDAYGWLDERELAPFTEAHDLYGRLWGSYDAQRHS